MFLVALGVVGAVGSLFSWKISWKWGFVEGVIGIVVLAQVGDEMNRITSINAKYASSGVYLGLGSGGYLATVASFLVIFAGIITVIKGYAVRASLSKPEATKELQKYKPRTGPAKPATGLRGPLLLNEETVNEEVGYGSPGVYALGRKPGKTFFVRYFGRSDSDINAKLKQHIGKYDQFKFEYFNSPEAAFTKECELYHAFSGPEGRLDNKTHPERPQGATWQCPKCDTFSSVSAAQTKNQFCMKCGSTLPLDSKFCSKCGADQT